MRYFLLLTLVVNFLGLSPVYGEGNKAVEVLSQVKAIAQVTKLEVIKRGMEHTELKVHFRRVKAVGSSKVPRQFTVKCFMKDSFFQKPNPKGPRLFKVKAKDRVYVTALREGGPMTSYTKITTELLNALIKSPEKVIIKDGKAIIEKAPQKAPDKKRRRRRRR